MSKTVYKLGDTKAYDEAHASAREPDDGVHDRKAGDP